MKMIRKQALLKVDKTGFKANVSIVQIKMTNNQQDAGSHASPALAWHTDQEEQR